VIGSGFGGLAAAIRLGARGYRVTVVEKLGGPGGRAGVLRQGGFTFDLGPTIVTAPFLFEELWALCGRRMADDVELRAMTPFYQIRFESGAVFNMSGDEAAMRAEVARFNPNDVEGFQRFMRRSEAIYRVGFERLGDAPFSSIVDMARIAGDLVRLGGHRSVYGLVSKYIRDERLRIVFSFHPLLIGGNPFRASAIYCLIPFLGKALGRSFRHGRHGRAHLGSCQAYRVARRRLAIRPGS
jgi:phytoene desaturase